MSVIISIFRPCMTKNGYAILLLLSQLKLVSFKEIKQCLKINDHHVNFYLKKFRELYIISTDSVTKLNQLTPFGSQILSAMDTFREKFMTENKESICKNSETSEHNFITLKSKIICRFCGQIHKELSQ